MSSFNVVFSCKAPELSHGDSICLVGSVTSLGLNQLSHAITLHTAPELYPYYETTEPVKISATSVNSQGFPTLNLTYQYALFSGGNFVRWEDSSAPRSIRVAMPELDEKIISVDGGDSEEELVMLVSDILLPSGSPPPSTQLPVPTPPNEPTSPRSLKRGVEFMCIGGISLESPTSSKRMSGSFRSTFTQHINRRRSFSFASSASDASVSPSTSPSQKTVKFGFDETPSSPSSAPVAPAGLESDHGSQIPPSPLPNLDLLSSDGVIVVSIFLPIILQRTESQTGATVWTADWDYENLLSMSTHMRVTRVGTVKWRGWHGNFGQSNKDSPESGVPMEERHLVERCLAPFNCVPVWCDVKVFGEAYNGFCKGILWPVFHNVSSVYNFGGVDAEGGANAMDDSTHGGMKEGESEMSETMSNSSSMSNHYDSDHAAGPIHGDGGRQAHLWSAYTQINKQFSDTIVQHFNEGDLIWIHGFQLLVLPSMLSRKVGRLAKIGLFLHTPFPSSEIFRTLWCREDILRGMLNADQVGFHLYEYARHFLTCCRRLLGLTYGMIPDTHGGHNLAIDTNGRQVTITSIHAGVETPLLKKCLDHSSTAEKVKAIKEQFKGKIIMGAIDRLENLKGTPLKILGLERFLDKRPEYRGKIVLVQVGISAFERGDDYKATKAEVVALVEKVNDKYPNTIQFQECAESEMRLNQRMALLRAVDIVMISSLRDGFNRLPLEFCVAHQDAVHVGIENVERALAGDPGAVRVRPGVCILSEFASSARVMRGSIHINPWKVAEIAHAIECSLSMDVDEHRRRLKYDMEFVKRVTTQRWALAVLLDLKGVKKNTEGQQYSGAGLGLGFRLLGMETGFKSLDTTQVSKGYRNSHKRLIMLDYGGTIVNDRQDKEGFNKFILSTHKETKRARIEEELISTLTSLCSDPRNNVFVVSGKERSAITETLGNVPNLGLAAEHGMYYSWPHQAFGLGEGGRKWEIMNSGGQDRSWRPTALTIMEVYTSRTHGSYIEQTESKVLWQYKDADPEFGALQSKELEDHLQSVLKSFHVEVLRGGGGGDAGGYIEVRPVGVSKGMLLRRVLEGLGNDTGAGAGGGAGTTGGAAQQGGNFNNQQVDFALIIGDDNCDEPMFEEMEEVNKELQKTKAKKGNRLRSLTRSTFPLVAGHIKYFTATVGKKPSAASSFLNDVEEVQELLNSLTKLSARERKYFSSVDLHSLGNSTTNSNKPSNLDSMLESLPKSANTETISAGMTRSVSMGNFGSQSKPLNSIFGGSAKTTTVSTSLNQFLSNSMEEEEEDNFF